MNVRTLTFSSLVLAALLIGGCGSGESADTSPLPNKDPPEGVGSATKSVESSNMTPEQKQAADAYLKQGAANAQQMQRSAQGASSGPPK